jgi:hypothetical protein
MYHEGTNMEIETVNDLRAILKEIGYSSKAISEIIKFYTPEPPMN